MPIPGSAVPCLRCGKFVIVGSPQTVPAGRITASKRYRGFYCQSCAIRLGWRP